MNCEPWPISTLSVCRKSINTNPSYQRQLVWTLSQKQLLMDTIIRRYDIPKLYFHEIGKKTYDVVDGQQRINAIFDFIDDKYTIANDADDVDGIKIAGKKFSELDNDIKMIISGYPLDIVIIRYAEKDEVNEMFLRLQNGTSLKAQEKRNAFPGNMSQFIKKISKHDFFKKVNFDNKRFDHDLVAAQMCLITINNKICNIKNNDLNKMYNENKDYKEDCSYTTNLNLYLNRLDTIFDKEAKELKRYNVISLFIIIMNLEQKYVLIDKEKEFREWFFDFEMRRNIDKEKEPDDQSPIFVAYKESTSHSTDGIESLEFRNKVLMDDLMEHVHFIEKDPNRFFSESQKQAIYRKDKQTCQICKKVCNNDEWEADHIEPWSKGGKTTIENGQVLCIPCNRKKNNKE